MDELDLTEQSLSLVELETEPDRALAIANIASEVTEERRAELPPKRSKTASRILRTGRRLPLILSTLALLGVAGCGNVEKPDTIMPPSTMPFITEVARPTATPMSFQTPESSLPTLTPITPPSTPTPEPPPLPTSTATIAPAELREKYKDELPADIIPFAELDQKYSTKIWNLPDIKLHLRNAVIENEPIFERLQTEDGFNRRLDIVLVNGPFVHSSFLTPEQKEGLPDVILEGLLEKEQDSRKKWQAYYTDPAIQATMFSLYEEEISSLEQDYQEGKLPTDAYNVTRLAIQEQYRPFIEGPTEEDLIVPEAAGSYIKPQHQLSLNETTGEYELTVRYAIFIAVREPEYIEFKSGGAVKIVSRLGVKAPHPDQSFPSPEDFPLTAHAEYPVQTFNPGFTVRHEFAHLSAGHPEADLKARNSLVRASEALKKGDDSLYYIVFETPAGNVITQRPQLPPEFLSS